MQLTRRQLGRIAIGGAVGALGAAPQKKVGFCIVGLGRISMQHFMPALKASTKAQVVALVSGHRDKAEEQAKLYGVPAKSIYSYENYDRIADNKQIDAVYIALPNNMHAEYTIRAAKAGKHVLCEKPMATTVKDSQEMIAACKTANRRLMIAYRCQFEPCNLRAIKMIRDGELGKITTIESGNGFNIKPNEWRLSGRMAGGGPLMDVGIYSLNACRYLTGEEPTITKAEASVTDRDGRFNEVEEDLSWSMKFPSGIVANCKTTYGHVMPGYYRVIGSKGMIHVEPAFAYQGERFTARIQGETPIDEPNEEKDPAQFVREADHMADCIRENREPKPNGEEGLKDMKLMMEIYKSCGRG